MVVPQVETLRRIHGITLKTARSLKSINFQSPGTPTDHDSASHTETPSLLHLPFPNDLIAPIISLEVSESLRSDILRCFTGRVGELQQKCNANYQKACALAPWLTHSRRNDKLRAAYQKLYAQQCRILIDSQFPYIVEEATKRQRSVTSHEKKTSFNHEYTPVLEKYFEYNAYPTLPDRLLLARKSMMSPRQIEVWFQNHRNRAKKDGLPLKRMSSNISSSFSFDNLDTETPHLIIAKKSPITIDSDSSEDESVGEQMDHCQIPQIESILTAVAQERPHHTFPVPYSAIGAYEPFLKDNSKFAFPAPIWSRHPTTAIKTTPNTSIDVDNLAMLFASKLDLRAASSKTARTSKTNAGKPHIKTWFSHTVTMPSSAPHPALIRTSYIPIPSSISIPACHEPYVCQQTSIRRQKPSAPCLSSSLPSWRIPNETRPRRKSPPFSRRTPSSMLSCMSHLPYPQPTCTRESSLSSISSSGTRSASTSSSSSSDSLTEPTSSLTASTEEEISLSNFAGQPAELDLFGDPYPQLSDETSHKSNPLNSANLNQLPSSDFSSLPSWCTPPMFSWFDS